MRVSALTILASGLLLAAGSVEPPAAATRPTAPPELVARRYLYEVVRHLYRWYLDERDLDPLANCREFVFRIRALQPRLDENDRSQFGEISLPQLGVRVKVKLADYTIPELDTAVKSDTFKIVAVSRSSTEGPPPLECTEVKIDFAEMRDELYQTRREARFPEGELLERLRRATRLEVLRNVERRPQEVPTVPQIVHLAPLSAVANEAWVFWESGRKLIRFASDIDLSNPTVWEHEELAVRLYDIDEHVVVSLDEVAGSNAYLTRAQVGRALFNCIVLGRRLELRPSEEETKNGPTSQRNAGEAADQVARRWDLHAPVCAGLVSGLPAALFFSRFRTPSVSHDGDRCVFPGRS